MPKRILTLINYESCITARCCWNSPLPDTGPHEPKQDRLAQRQVNVEIGIDSETAPVCVHINLQQV